jgi:uncharacterized protein (DUF2236 family)
MDRTLMSRIHRERVLLVGGQRALVLQLAHPKVAGAVADHSDFPSRALERLRRTLDLSLATVFGSRREAEAATGRIRAVHERVSGVGETGPYSAKDPWLLQWVNATLIDTTLVTYERFVRPLDESERARYYEETLEWTGAFGIPPDVVPPDLPAFRSYMRGMVEGDELGPTEAGRELVASVLRPPLPLPFRAATEGVRLVTLALLPAPVRQMFGLRAGVRAHAALAAATAASRAALPFLPSSVREFSAARRAAS